MSLLLRYSPLGAWKKWRESRAGKPPRVVDAITPTEGVLSEYRLAVELQEAAEAFVKTRYHRALLDFLELRAGKLFDDFRAGKYEKDAYFALADLLKDVSEHPIKLIRSGQAAAKQLGDWDQHGLTREVAAADASRARGEDHAGR